MKAILNLKSLSLINGINTAYCCCEASYQRHGVRVEGLRGRASAYVKPSDAFAEADFQVKFWERYDVERCEAGTAVKTLIVF